MLTIFHDPITIKWNLQRVRQISSNFNVFFLSKLNLRLQGFDSTEIDRVFTEILGKKWQISHPSRLFLDNSYLHINAFRTDKISAIAFSII